MGKEKTKRETFRELAAGYGREAIETAAAIMRNSELSPAARLDAGKWLARMGELEPAADPQLGVGGSASITIILDRPALGSSPPCGPGVITLRPAIGGQFARVEDDAPAAVASEADASDRESSLLDWLNGD